MDISDTLVEALQALCKMKYPSVPDLLRKYGYYYEAGVIQKVIEHAKEEVV